MTGWGQGLVPGADETYLLLRRGPDGTLQAISFDRGIVRRMGIDEYEWKPIDDRWRTKFPEISPTSNQVPPPGSGERGGEGAGTTGSPSLASGRGRPVTAGVPASRIRKTGPCGCPCSSGGFCGGCGHAGCGRRFL